MNSLLTETVLVEDQETIDVESQVPSQVAPSAGDLVDRRKFLNSTWFTAWARHLIPKGRWMTPATVFRLERNGRKVGEAVFARQAVPMVKVLSLGGYYWPFRGGCRDDRQLSSEQFATHLAKALTEKTDCWMLRLSPILDIDEDIQGLSERLRLGGWSKFTRESGRVFELLLPTSETELQEAVSDSLIRNVRYMRRRAEKDLGAITCTRYAGESLTTERMDEAACVEEQSWVTAKQGDVKILGSGNRAFWQQLLETPQTDVEVVLWLLHLGGRPVAFSFHLETRRTLYVLANSYVNDLKQYSLGSVLTHQVLCDSIIRGIRLVDWGAGDSGYKQKWGAKRGSMLQEHLLFRPTLLGRLGAFIVGRCGSGWIHIQ